MHGRWGRSQDRGALGAQEALHVEGVGALETLLAHSGAREQPSGGLGSDTQTVSSPSKHSNPEPHTNLPPQLDPRPEATDVGTRDILPKRSQATLTLAPSTKGLPRPEVGRKRKAGAAGAGGGSGGRCPASGLLGAGSPTA